MTYTNNSIQCTSVACLAERVLASARSPKSPLPATQILASHNAEHASGYKVYIGDICQANGWSTKLS